MSCLRITPADAGKTPESYTKSSTHWDHPRGCGENIRLRQLLHSSKGSPPRMRGKRALSHMQTVSPRITPADAGKTTVLARHRRGLQDHPRGCGENPLTKPLTFLSRGSPPRMRGKRAAAAAAAVAPGDHPRGCGENRATPMKQKSRLGSPPRMRGKPTIICSGVNSSGITPADAGKTARA